jgi:hypothetical protein
VLGFHGCDHAVAERVFAGNAVLKPSRNSYDWLGHGVYFWENSPDRARDYARSLLQRSKASRGRVRKPAVIGAVIDLGYCLNLLDAAAIQLVKNGHEQLHTAMKLAGGKMPTNRAPGQSAELLLRNLDCAVIQFVHEIRERDKAQSFDSVRAAFMEGKPVYDTAGFHERTHIQICVRNQRQIKGYFRVLPEPAL